MTKAKSSLRELFSDEFIRALDSHDLLTAKEEQRLARSRLRKSKNELVMHNLRLVVKIVQKFRFKGIADEDLVQLGCEGLVNASIHFSPGRGRFSTYAFVAIKKRILRQLLDHNTLVRVPNCARIALNTLKDKMGIKGSGLSKKEQSKFCALSSVIEPTKKPVLNLALPPVNGGGREGEYIPARSEVSPERRETLNTTLSALRVELERLIAILDRGSISQRDRDVFCSYYQIDGQDFSFEGLVPDEKKHPTLESVAKKHLLTRERVRQITVEVSKALFKESSFFSTQDEMIRAFRMRREILKLTS